VVGLVVGLLVGAEFRVCLRRCFAVCMLVCFVFGGLFLFVGVLWLCFMGVVSACRVYLGTRQRARDFEENVNYYARDV